MVDAAVVLSLGNTTSTTADELLATFLGATVVVVRARLEYVSVLVVAGVHQVTFAARRGAVRPARIVVVDVVVLTTTTGPKRILLLLRPPTVVEFRPDAASAPTADSDAPATRLPLILWSSDVTFLLGFDVSEVIFRVPMESDGLPMVVVEVEAGVVVEVAAEVVVEVVVVGEVSVTVDVSSGTTTGSMVVVDEVVSSVRTACVVSALAISVVVVLGEVVGTLLTVTVGTITPETSLEFSAFDEPNCINIEESPPTDILAPLVDSVRGSIVVVTEKELLLDSTETTIGANDVVVVAGTDCGSEVALVCPPNIIHGLLASAAASAVVVVETGGVVLVRRRLVT